MFTGIFKNKKCGRNTNIQIKGIIILIKFWCILAPLKIMYLIENKVNVTPVIPALWEAEEGWSPEVRSLRAACPTWQNPVSTKSTKISWAWCQVPVIPATQEAEAGESFEPGRQRLQWAEIVPLPFSLSKRVRTCLKKKKERKEKCYDPVCPLKWSLWL